MKAELEKTKKALGAKTPRRPETAPGDYLSTGLDVLNMALSDRADGGIPKGCYLYFVGDTSSGKSWLSFHLFAEAARGKAFAGHRLIFDDVENGALMDVAHYFGKETMRRVEPPAGTRKKPKYSRTAEEFYFHLDDAFERKEPFVYILDSMDSLTSNPDVDKFKEAKAAHAKNESAAGSYGVAKARINSGNINRYATALRDTGSILVVISQTRDKIGSFFAERTWGGGKALWFYAHALILTSVAGKIKKNVLGKERVVGKNIKIEVKKNRITGGEDQTVYAPFRRKFGFDNTESLADFLIAEGHWKKNDKGIVTAPEFDFTGKKENLVRQIETEDGEPELRALAQGVWGQIQEACAPQRKPRYT